MVSKTPSQATINRQKSEFNVFANNCLNNSINIDFNDAFNLSVIDFAKKYKLKYKSDYEKAKVRLVIAYIKYRTKIKVPPPPPPPPQPFPFKTVTTSNVVITKKDKRGRFYTRTYKFVTTAITERHYKRRFIEYNTTASINRECPSEIPPVESLVDVLTQLRQYLKSKKMVYGFYFTIFTKFYTRSEKVKNTKYKSITDFYNKIITIFRQICIEVLVSDNKILGYETFINEY